jgi:hypothetical protein
MLQKEILKFFHCCLGLGVRKDMSKSQVLCRTTWKNYRTTLNSVSPPFQHKCMTVREPFCEASAEPENLAYREEEELCELQ